MDYYDTCSKTPSITITILNFSRRCRISASSLEARFALEDKLIRPAVAHNLSNDVRDDNIAPTA